MIKSDLIKWAKSEIDNLLENLPQRLKHIYGVAKRADYVGQILEKADRQLLVSAAYLHDIGYSEKINKTGFHPLDGAIYLKSKNHLRLASLVAYHSHAECDAKLLGLEKELNKFENENSVISDLLTYSDITTSPKGTKMTVDERIEDILRRYDKDSIVTKSVIQSKPYIKSLAKRVESMLIDNGLDDM